MPNNRYKFYQVSQDFGEEITEFIIRLKWAAQTCEFGDFLTGNGAAFKVNVLEDALIDRFIIGLNSQKIQQALLSEKEQKFDTICNIALNMELSQREVLAMKPIKQHAAELGAVNAIRNNQSKVFKPCRRCARKHDEKNCPASKWQCFSCLKYGPGMQSKSKSVKRKKQQRMQVEQSTCQECSIGVSTWHQNNGQSKLGATGNFIKNSNHRLTNKKSSYPVNVKGRFTR